MTHWMHISGSRAGSPKITTGPLPFVIAESPDETGPIDLLVLESALQRPAMTGAQLATSDLSDEQVRTLVRTLMGRKTN